MPDTATLNETTTLNPRNLTIGEVVIIETEGGEVFTIEGYKTSRYGHVQFSEGVQPRTSLEATNASLLTVGKPFTAKIGPQTVETPPIAQITRMP